ncbi:TPA: hypothetical protein N0F65_007796 [Lagenidium giganteum]|uniref:Uncharacterized protein n=1 Tax=Lagenidium giganteum TaxID=4803 RepID=A0AAV2Z174_9STRA|nr:TPA: hypothetical protein N0F65_007796 [Lagenidium giganteum]
MMCECSSDVDTMQAATAEANFLVTNSQDVVKTWSLNHQRLLYLLSRFAMYPSSTDEDEKWLRNLPLLVMVYEAIVHGVLDYDYSPVCTNIVKNGRSRRIWMNISQDAKAAIDDLREHDLVNALKTCSEDFQPSTAYQVTPQAVTLLKNFPVEEKKAIDAFLSAPSNKHGLMSATSGMILFDGGLLKITFDVDDGKFRFIRSDGSVTVSRVTDIEEVSYVSSPYLPNCLMRNEAAFSSNSAQAAKCSQGISGIKDELSFAIVLSQVRVLVGEWIPFGSNQIVTLNDRLGSLERCQGGLFTSELDDAPTSTSLHVAPGLTKIAIVDFEFESFTNFEADIHAPHDEGIVQIESFGMHLNGDGSIIYGMFIDAIMDQKAESIYVDHLSRLLVDVDLDSSKIINDLLSPHQRNLMDMLFMDDARSRNKFSLIIAKEITPKLPVREYLDRGEKENELKQVLGEIHSVYDLSDDDKILIGREGMLLVGPNSSQHEPLIVAHLALLSRELFIRFFFKRTFILDDNLNRARTYMKNFEENPEALDAMRKRISQCSHDLILLEEILELLRESMRALEIPNCPTDPGGMLLYEKLQLKKTLTDLEIRCKDLAKLLRGFRAKLKQVHSQNGNTSKTILERVVQSIERNVGVMADTTDSNERFLGLSFDVLLVIFLGFLAFEFIDRLTDGKLLGLDGDLELNWANKTLNDVVEIPGLWLLLELLVMAILVVGMKCLSDFLITRLTRVQRASFVVNQRVNIQALERFMQPKLIESRTSNFGSETKVIKVIWREEQSQPLLSWHRGRPKCNIGPPLHIQVCFDVFNRYLLDVSFQGQLQDDKQQLFDDLMDQLRKNSCFDQSYTAQIIDKKQSKSRTLTKDFLFRLVTRRNVSIHPTQES